MNARTAGISATSGSSLNKAPEVWWRHPMVWLVLGGPAVVVVACLATYWIAVTHPDPLVDDSASPGTTLSQAEMPAQQARNQAAAATR